MGCENSKLVSLAALFRLGEGVRFLKDFRGTMMHLFFFCREDPEEFNQPFDRGLGHKSCHGEENFSSRGGVGC